MALLPTERPRQIALLVGFLALAAIYVVFEYWHTPRVQEVTELEARLEQIEDRNRRAQIVAARGGAELEERLAVYQRHIQRLEQLIPQSEEVPSLLNSIATEARRTGVDLGSLRPEPSVPGEFYNRQSYEMAAVGEYHDVARFLTAVASLPRIITPLDMEVAQHTGAAPRADVENPVVARFRIETYVLPSGPLGGIPEGPGSEEGAVTNDGENQ